MKNQTAKEDPRTSFDELKLLRDEIRLNLHLAGMDLRDEWKKIEKRLQSHAPRAHASDANEEAVKQLKSDIQAFKHRLHHEQHADAHH